MGERSIESCNSIMFEDLTNNVKCVIKMNTYVKSGYFRVTETGKKDEFDGLIYRCPEINIEQSNKKNFGKNPEFISDLKNIKDII